MSTELEYFPPSTVSGIDSVVFGESKPYLLRDIEGFASLPNQPTTSRGPYQPGATLLDNQVGPKRLLILVTVKVETREDYWTKRSELAHALSVVPRFDLRRAELGTLRITREGQDVVEIECVPVGAPEFTGRGRTLCHARFELFAPSPWWRSTDDIREFFESAGGIEIIAEGNTDEGLAIAEEGSTDEGVAIPLDRETVEVNNDGHAPAPLTIEITGQCDTPRLELVETGESLQVDGVINSGETIRISTEFGQKEVTLIDSNGDESNAFDRLNTDHADFFWLDRGANTLRGTFATNVSGGIEVRWRKRYAGV